MYSARSTAASRGGPGLDAPPVPATLGVTVLQQLYLTPPSLGGGVRTPLWPGRAELAAGEVVHHSPFFSLS
jgi:hypothetical protein